MNGTASPGPSATLPGPPPADADHSSDSPLDDLSSAPSDDEELFADAPAATNGHSPARAPPTPALATATATTADEPTGHHANGLTGGLANGINGTNGTNGLASGRPATPDTGDAPDAHDTPDTVEQRPAKRQRTRASTPPPPGTPSGRGKKAKDISPPWKKVAADGPSSFREGGRRKSGRINAVPLELQAGDKRITRRAVQAHQSASPPSARQQAAAANGPAPRPAAASPSVSAATRRVSAPRSRQPPQAAAAATATSTTTRHTPRHAAPASSGRPQRGSQAQRPPPTAPSRSQPARPSRHARLQRGAAASQPEIPTRTTPRIRLRTRTLTIPVVHPDQVKLRPRLAPTLATFFATAADVPVEQGGLFAAEDDVRITDDMAASDAALIERIERETEAGGILAAPRCSAFQPEAAEEPPRQWAHADHMAKAAANFRRLMGLEQQRHRAAAKRLAEACRAEWLRRQPKSAEQLETEARALWMGRYRIVVRALAGTWENIKTEINRRRVREWEAEEQRRVNAALQEAVALSEQKLQARRTQMDSEAPSDDDGLESLSESGDADGTDSSGGDDGGGDNDGSDDDDDDDNDEDDESNMSSSGDDEDDGDNTKDNAQTGPSDEGLTQDQLRQKYANLPDIADITDTHADNETSDESVDMDDDLGSTDMDSDDDDDDEGSGAVDGSDGDNETSDDEDGQTHGLLGMLFGKSELKKLKAEPPVVQEPADDATGGAAVKEEDAADVPVPNGGDERRQSDARPAFDDNAMDAVEEDDDDVDMVDMPPAEDGTEGMEAAADTAPSVAVAMDAPPAADEDKTAAPSPETDAVTTAVSPDRSQSPRTLDTKPSDLDTPMSGSEQAAPAASGTAGKDSSVANGVPIGTNGTNGTDGTNSRASRGRSSVSPSPAPTTTAASVPKTEIPFLLRGTLRAYQHDGLDWLAGLYANRTNGILADEMGLGKTIQTIALLAHLACHHEVWGPHLVIVPTSVLLNWEMEFKKWCPAFKILTYYGSQDERKRKRIGWTNDDIWNVCITSYQIVVQDQQVFKRRRWHYMILDEAHNIKNFKSQRWQSLLGFNTQARLLLTGTPLQNNLTELWSLLFFLMPPENGLGGFADLAEFHDWFHKPESQILESGRAEMDDEARAIIAKLHKVLRPYLLRRLKADVEKQMPAKYEHVELCRLSKRQRELYDGFLARSDTRATLASGNYLSIINCLMQLRKVCNHPDLFVDRPIMTSFCLPRSVPAAYASATEHLQRRWLQLPARPGMADAAYSSAMRGRVNLQFLNLVPTVHETALSASTAARINQLATNRVLAELRDAQRARLPQPFPRLDARTVQSSLAHVESAARWRRFEALQHCAYVNGLRRQQRPVYGQGLLAMLTLGVEARPFRPRPRVPAHVLAWFESDSFLLHTLVQPLDRRAEALEGTISKFACVTPAVVTRDMNGVLLGERGAAALGAWDLRLSAPVKRLPFMARQAPRDPWHEARMRLTIQFPDKRLLQYDCGKLQALDRLLRRLQAGGHRALIFTQMTKVLDILEQFLNIHGHKYLRLDGATKIEQRQVLTDRFNHDNRILCFILSTRSGGLGINLTGADTVIFYDQDWNPAMDKQCQDRCHRIGQTRDVHIYRLVSEHTIEANILRKASQKQMLDDVVIQEGEFTTDYFTKAPADKASADADADADVTKAGGRAPGGNEGLIRRFREGNAAANAAIDRVLGTVETAGDPRTAGRVLEQAEDTEDVAAARLAEKEILEDDAEFSEKPAAATPGTASGVSSVRQGTPAAGTATAATAGTALGRSGLGLFAESLSVDGSHNGQPAMTAPGADADADADAAEHNAWGAPMHTVDDFMLGWMAEQLQGTPLDLPKDKKKSKKKKGKDTRKR